MLDPARAAAIDVLKAVRVDRAYTNLVLPAVIRHYGLEGRDAAFTTELASGTIRRRGTYDAILAACTDRPLSKVEARVLDALRVGTHQLLSMRVPDHAAISTTVDLVRARMSTGAGNFVNAVLRSVSEHDLAEWIDRVAARRRSPPTLRVDRVQPPRVGRRRAEGCRRRPRAARAARRRQREPRGHARGAARPLDPRGAARASRPPTRRTAWSWTGATRAPCRPWPRGGRRSRTRGPSWSPWRWPTPLSRARTSCWLDLCAGPGGKSGLLAGLAAERGSSGRQRAAASARRPGPRGRSARTTAGGRRGRDRRCATAPWPPYRNGIFDRVLVDAPCTGLGALRRRPEARWRRKPDDLLTLVMLQRQLVRAALDLVRPGGVLLYATCSPVLSETSIVVTVGARGPV